MYSAAWIVLAAAFGIFALWETFAPRQPCRLNVARRWFVNVALWALGAFCWRSLMGVTVVTVAALASRGRPAQPWQLAGAILLLDFIRYVFHRSAHALPWFWRVHLVHHSDRDVDCTSGLRFHPLEAIAEHAWVIAWVWALALPASGVAAAELLTIFATIAEHANVTMPRRLERALGLIFVTPETHRVHHSADPCDYGSNFGTVFALWDRLLGTWTPAPAGHLQFGAAEVSSAASVSLVGVLAAPFSRKARVSGQYSSDGSDLEWS